MAWMNGESLDGKLAELRDRLINIESKINTSMSGRSAQGESVPGVNHPDQWFGGYTWAQHGDDLVALNIFRTIGIERPSYLDIGAHHPFRISNTALLYRLGSRGINVEANPNLIEEFYRHRPEDVNLNVGVAGESGTLKFYMIDKWSGRNTFNKESAEEFVRMYPSFQISEIIDIPVVTVTDILNQFCNGMFPDFLSLDVEGLDLSILQSIDFSRSAPKLICVEANTAEDAKPLNAFLSVRGYELIFRAGGNIHFLQNHLKSQWLGC